MQNQKYYFHVCAGAAFVLLAAVLQISGIGWMRQLELTCQDALMRYGRPAKPSPKLIFLARDSASASLETADLDQLFDLRGADAEERRALTLMVHEWPWSREVYALILDRLTKAGASSVAFDFSFPKPSPEDDAFRNSLALHRDRVTVAGNITDETEGGGETSVFGSTATTLIPESSPRDPRIGFDNFWPDEDSVVRSAQYRWALERGHWQGNEEFSLAARALQKAGFGDAVPADRQSHRLRFAGPSGTFRAYSIYQLFVPKYWQENFAGGEFFRNKIVVIAASGNWQHDEHQTTLGPMAGGELQLNAVNAALQHEFVHSVPWQGSLALLALSGAIATALCILFALPVVRTCLMVLVCAIWAGSQFLLYNHAGIFIPVAGPLMILTFMGLSSIIYDLVRALAREIRLQKSIAERKRAQQALEAVKEELERRVEERTFELSRSNASLKSLLGEKDVLLKEIHHRVKNNLQIISSLLNLQSGYIEDRKALQVFNESRNRVRAMSLIHEKLYQSQDLSQIDFADYIGSLTSSLRASFASSISGLSIDVDGAEIMMSVGAAVPCGLIVNELVTNSFKYAFKPGQEGKIKIRLERNEPAHLRLSVADDGVGLPKGFDFRTTESLGMQIVTTLTEQLEGTMEVLNGTGTTFVINFPEGSKREQL